MTDAGGSGGAGTTGVGGTTGAADGGARCEQGSDCASGTCWEQLDGANACISPAAGLALGSCQYAGTACCGQDAECTDGKNGRCWPKSSIDNCGGAAPQGNVCLYDQCSTDADCKAGMPTGSTVGICLPAGALGRKYAECVYGVCRTNADCTKHGSGSCQIGFAAPHGQCVFHDVLFCEYPTDACPKTACAPPMACLPSDDLQGRQCSQAWPMYP